MIDYLYRYLVWPMIYLTFKLASYLNPKVRAGWQARQPQNGIKPWLRGVRASHPVWIHCSSGELEYAKPIIRSIYAKYNRKLPVIITYFSPSVAESAIATVSEECAFAMPWDTLQTWTEFIEFYRPRALLIARTDAWYEMCHAAQLAEIPSLMFATTFCHKSGRAKPMVRLLTTKTLARLTEIHAVSRSDQQALLELGLNAKSIVVTGDTRFDQVLHRLSNAKKIPGPLPNWPRSSTLIAGSTWPEDESVLVQLISQSPKLKFIIVPHEPSPDHISRLQNELLKKQIRAQLFSEKGPFQPETQVMIFDRVGFLAELYRLGAMAFVGGSFRKSVHSVMEPLAAGCATFVGPFIQNNREALLFLQRQVPGTELYPVMQVKSAYHWSQTLTDLGDRLAKAFDHELVGKIQALVYAQTGATQAAMAWLENHVDALDAASSKNRSERNPNQLNS